MTGSAADTFPQVDPSIAVWAQCNRNALIRDQDEWAESSSPAMSAIFAVIKMFYAHQDTQDFWQESYTTCMYRIMRAEGAQQKLRRRVRKHKKVAREPLWDTDDAHTALGAL